MFPIQFYRATSANNAGYKTVNVPQGKQLVIDVELVPNASQSLWKKFKCIPKKAKHVDVSPLILPIAIFF
jgi:hypothetical protein